MSSHTSEQQCSGPSLSSLAPPIDPKPTIFSYTTSGGIQVTRTVEPIPLTEVLDTPLKVMDRRHGGIFTSNYEYPDRYRRFDISFVDPPLMLEGYGRRFTITALNSRGIILLDPLYTALQHNPAVKTVSQKHNQITGEVLSPEGSFSEEDRSRQPSIFSILRVFQNVMGSPEDPHLGLYGAFGYDLVFQFEPIPRKFPPSDDPDLVLFMPDEIRIADRPRDATFRVRYDFEVNGLSTISLPRSGTDLTPAPARVAPECDHNPGEYAKAVEIVREGCRQGDFFEVVPSQTFAIPTQSQPSQLFDALRKVNPSPYGFLLNLGKDQLIGASPEMFVRVEGNRVETCPISGTIARGSDPLSDARQILTLLNSSKDESELTMCTDVDRNDKSRICIPGSVKVLGRRQLELYSRVIHTVDHVDGLLRPGYDALDAFLSHTWAVTVTGAPKRAAMACIEKLEKTPRRFYGGAIGFFTFNGNINTGITIRTIHLRGGIAEVRAGATLLYDSVPEDEERETRTKASAMLDVIRRSTVSNVTEPEEYRVALTLPARPVNILLVDHEDSFVHTLANYFRQAGGEVTTLRAPIDTGVLDKLKPDMVLLSPGPGRPAGYGVPDLVRLLAKRHTPTFGVCLGLQGMVEAFGGRLGILNAPVHGKTSSVTHQTHPLFEGIPPVFQAGRYHSLYALPETMPADLEVLAKSEDGVIMAIASRTLRMAAVQFHPESILTTEGGYGILLVQNALKWLVPEAFQE